ncbi:MAG: NUDIX domain-containing protein, partial [Devosiaceae bacterium]|nr:NUDIX domain-containing protein [Devosiaceae bacterium]
WHRSSIVYLFHPDGRMYVQRRAACKDLYENLLDHSVGEHLIPGETHVEAAHRGLREELGISIVELETLGGERRLCTEIPEKGIQDNEFQQVFKGTYEGDMRLDPKEVSQIRLFSTEQLISAIEREPEIFTPWFESDLVTFGFLP